MFLRKILTILFIQVFHTDGVFGSPQKTLLDKLIDDYGNRSLRPVRNLTDTTVVYFRMLVAQLVGFDERMQQLTINGWMKQVWRDEYLEWNPSNHGGVEELSISTSDVWIPDITLFENVDPRYENYKDTNAHVTYDGTIDWMAPALLKTSCKVSVLYFPFDTQKCILRFAFWAYDGGKLDLMYTNDTDAAQNVFYQNGVWELIHVEVNRELVHYNCCTFPYVFINYVLTIRRNSTYYYFNIIVPCLLLSVLQLLVFWLPPDSGEKISLGMSNLLALILFQQLIAESTPPLGDETPLIGQYFFVMVVLGVISITSTVCVLHIYHKDKNHLSHTVCKLLLSRFTTPSPFRRLFEFIKEPGKMTPRNEREHKTIATTLTSLFSDIGRSHSHEMTAIHAETENKTMSKCSYCGHLNKDVSTKTPESNHSNDSVEEKPNWKDVAIFIDRFMFYLLSICMSVVCLYVVVDCAVHAT